MRGETGESPVRARRREAPAICREQEAYVTRIKICPTWMPQSKEHHWGNLRRWTSSSAKSKYPSVENLRYKSKDEVHREGRWQKELKHRHVQINEKGD